MNKIITDKIILQSAYIKEGRLLPSQSLVYDLYMDSVMLVDMTCELENAFNVRISEEEIGKIQCVQDVYHLLEKKAVKL